VRLQHGGEEALRELEDRQHVLQRELGGQPLAQLGHALDQVVEPGAQGLETQKRQLEPVVRHLVDQEAAEHLVQFRRHERDAFDRILECHQRLAHLDYQLGEFLYLVEQIHSLDADAAVVAALFDCLGGLRAPQRFGQDVQELLDDVLHGLLRAAAAFLLAAGLLRDRHHDHVELLHARVELEGDVGVGMHAEDLGRVLVGQLPDLLDPVPEVVGLLGLGQLVDAALAEVVVVHRVQALVHEHAQCAADDPVVQFLRDAAAVRYLAYHVFNRIVWNRFFAAEVAQSVETRRKV